MRTEYPALEILKLAAFNGVPPTLFNDPVGQLRSNQHLRDKIQKHVYSTAPHELVTDTPSLYLMAERMSYANAGQHGLRPKGQNEAPWLPFAAPRPFVSPSILQSFNQAAGAPTLLPDPHQNSARALLHYPATDLRHIVSRSQNGHGTETLFYNNTPDVAAEAVRRRSGVDAFLRNLRSDDAGLRGHLQLNRSDLDQFDALARGTGEVPTARPRGFSPLVNRRR